MKKKPIYTFDDWLENNFWTEEGYSEQLMVNDSENYLELVSKGKMTYETLNKIQNAQSETYQYIVNKTLETNRKFLQINQENSLDFNKYLELSIEQIELDLEKNKKFYFEILMPRLHRGIKYGAKFLLPEEYKKFKKSEFMDGYIPVYTPYSILEDGKMKHFPNDEDRKFLRMEIKVQWLKYLKEIQKGGKIESISPQPIEKRKEKLSDLITHKNSIEIVEVIKTQYKNIKGKRLKLLLLALQELSLIPKDRINQKFYDCCMAEFGWNIASYTAMNDYKFNAVIDKNELEEMKKHIETLAR